MTQLTRYARNPKSGAYHYVREVAGGMLIALCGRRADGMSPLPAPARHTECKRCAAARAEEIGTPGEQGQADKAPFTERARVRYAVVGRGKRVHYSPMNDETLCGRLTTNYVDAEAADLFSKGYELCIPCHRRAEQRADAARLAESSPLAAAAVALAETVETDAADAPAIAAELPRGIIEPGARVRVPLGRAVVTAMDDDYVSVRFDDGTEGRVAAESPHIYRLCDACDQVGDASLVGDGRTCGYCLATAQDDAARTADAEPTPERDEPSDTWTIMTRSGEEIARVDGATAEDMTRAAEALPEVQANIRREGGFSRRRLYVSELRPSSAEQRLTAAQAAYENSHRSAERVRANPDPSDPEWRAALAELGAALERWRQADPSIDTAEDAEGTWRAGWIGAPLAADDGGLFPAADALGGERGEQGGLFA
ncbi:hypothetical protein ACFV5N_27215 [Streptomyces sp. NPDC059853]|uniref:hypothetical protein n=1 Tax=Streptomyces sp. NPDC059853 TaxID=3346973 RepID=UPI00365766B1